MSNRCYNFGAGPCTLPLEVLEEAQQEFVEFQNKGMSILEMSHRGETYEAVHNEAVQLAKELYQTPNDFEVLFIQGGATLQFSMIPMNFLKENQKAAYIICGTWSEKAYEDAIIYGKAYKAWDGKPNSFIKMPFNQEIKIEENTSYLHITSNETIGGLRMIEWPEVKVPMIADMSSDFFTRLIPWEKFDLVYGGVQKNLGPAGMAVVFIRKSKLENLNKNIGKYLRYDIHDKNNSLYNTPPVFPIYMTGKVLKHIKKTGGIQGVADRAQARANMIYHMVDQSNGYYRCPIEIKYRSLMNIVFRLPTESLEKKFLSEATKAGFIGLEGHRSVGGCRASCYNALPLEWVEALTLFMKNFQKQNA